MYKEIQAFLGVAGHYRRFIKNYARIALPLTDYLKGDGSKKKKEGVVLNKEAVEAFNTLKHSVLSAPILVYPDPKKEYLLETDASCLDPGVVLSQHQEDGKYHPVAFGSRTLLPAETRYHSTKLEFLAMKWGIMHFSLYLMGKKFRVRRDNNPLIYFAMYLNLDMMKHQWIGELAPYDFSVEYQKGKLNIMADVLSMMTGRLDKKETDSYLQTMEANTSADSEVDVQDEPPSQDDESEYKSPWPPPVLSGKKEVPKLGEVEVLSSKAVQALFDGITMENNRLAEREWDQSIVIDREEDDINLGVRVARLTTPMHIIN